MFKSIFFIIAVIVLVRELFILDSSESMVNLVSKVFNSDTKCLTEDGKVLYGRVPEGISCKQVEDFDTTITVVENPLETELKNNASNFNNLRCDGRQHCSQMRSRAEAVFFTNNCPNTKMDGDGDGIPCENESRW